MHYNNTKIIYVFDPSIINEINWDDIRQKKLHPIGYIDNKLFFFSKEEYIQENTLSNQKTVIIPIYENFNDIKRYIITDILYNGIVSKINDIQITDDYIVYKKNKKIVFSESIEKNLFQDIYNFLRIFCSISIINDDDVSGVFYANFCGNILGVRVSFFQGLEDFMLSKKILISIRIIYNEYIYQNIEISHNIIETLHEPGLVLIGGKTGVGKTTFFYNLLHKSFLFSKKTIISIEDPVEIILNFMFQREYNKDYEKIITSLLRHNPDIIGFGEIRDKEIAKMCIRSLLTGHGVIGTIHIHKTENIHEEILNRFEEFGLDIKYILNKLKYFIFIKNNYEYEIISLKEEKYFLK